MESLQGQLLIATPELMDPNFSKSVVLIVQHNEQGALGLVLNRPTPTTLESVWSQVSQIPCELEVPVHQGGPCEGPLMVLHGHPPVAQIDICQGVCFSTDKSAVESLVNLNHEPIMFFYGHSGWAAGQLEVEMATGSWLTSHATSENVFQNGPDLWELLIRRSAPRVQTIDPSILPEDPTVN